MSFGKEGIIEKIAKITKEKAELLEMKEKLDRAERERIDLQYRREESKKQAQREYENDLRNRQAERD